MLVYPKNDHILGIFSDSVKGNGRWPEFSTSRPSISHTSQLTFPFLLSTTLFFFLASFLCLFLTYHVVALKPRMQHLLLCDLKIITGFLCIQHISLSSGPCESNWRVVSCRNGMRWSRRSRVRRWGFSSPRSMWTTTTYSSLTRNWISFKRSLVSSWRKGKAG